MSNECPFVSNSFCATLSQDQRNLLCAGCRIKTYPAGAFYELEYWHRGPALLAEGFMVLGSRGKSEDQVFRARNYLHGGEPLWFGTLVRVRDEFPYVDEATCFTDCAIAFLDKDISEELYNTDIEFCKTLAEAIGESAVSLERHLCCETAYEKVHYFLDYCRSNGFFQFTHEQIAVACNLSRQTVTKLMSELTIKEPELFLQSKPSNTR